MGKSVRHLIGAGGIVAAAGAATYLAVLSTHGTGGDEIFKALADAPPPGRVVIQYPLDGTLFPPEIAPPSFPWKDDDPHSDLWLVRIEFADARPMHAFAEQSPWRPQASLWETIKRQSIEKSATVTIIGVNRKKRSQVLSAGHVTIKTSSDKVAAPLFYREVSLDPGNVSVRYNLAVTLARLKQYDQAIAQAAGDEELIGKITRQITLYKQRQP